MENYIKTISYQHAEQFQEVISSLDLNEKAGDISNRLATYLASRDVISNRQEAEVVFSQLATYSSKLSKDDIRHIIQEVRQKRSDFDHIED